VEADHEGGATAERDDTEDEGTTADAAATPDAAASAGGSSAGSAASVGALDAAPSGATIAGVYSSGLCMQCGTCAALCNQGAITMRWDVREGLEPVVSPAACNECGTCLEVCPGPGLDFTDDAWWRERNEGAPSADFLGPWRRLAFGWAADADVRYQGASGGVATAIMQGALAAGRIDAALVCRMDPENALATEPVIARTAEEISACRGSKYNVAATNVLLRRVIEEPGRYALIGLPCHIQGLRLAQRHHPLLRKRIVLAIGLFCGWTGLPQLAAVAARRAGLSPRELASVSYRGPDWPGVMRLETHSGDSRVLPYPDYYDDLMFGYVPTRCRLCPDALADLADISVGDAWLDRFDGTPGVSDLIARTEAGVAMLEELSPDALVLEEARPGDMVASQKEAYVQKRLIYRGRRWLRQLAGRAVPQYPGVPGVVTTADRLHGARDLARQVFYKTIGDLRYP